MASACGEFASAESPSSSPRILQLAADRSRFRWGRWRSLVVILTPFIALRKQARLLHGESPLKIHI